MSQHVPGGNFTSKKKYIKANNTVLINMFIKTVVKYFTKKKKNQCTGAFKYLEQTILSFVRKYANK